ncbi:MAG: LuxR C-terminal-related transcriptional regulator [Thermomicrobiales bacterium]
MDTALLATHVRIPPEPRHLVSRSRLVDALERGIPEYKLILITAPAGFGKTTLLCQWARASSYPVVWHSVTADDNDLVRFFRYLVRAWAEIQPDILESPLGLLVGSTDADTDQVLRALLTAAGDLPRPTVFVLDDLHVVDDPAVHQALTFLLDHLPPAVHLVFAGREAPPLPIARYRARHELLELQAEELQFELGETKRFLTEHMALDLSDGDIASVHDQLEGWIAGLQLASLTLQRHRETADSLVVTGRHRFIADYLRDDVLAALPAEDRWFLLQTSILDRLCGSLCDAVTGRGDGQAMLESLERANLFLLPLDDDRTWYRYHRLFADFLRDELQRAHQDALAELHRRSAKWYVAQDLPEQAFQHALTAGDLDLTVDVFNRYINFLVMGCEFRLLGEWLDAIPADWYSTYPALGLGRTALWLNVGDFGNAMRCLEDVEHRLRPEERQQRARASAIRCFIACFQNDIPQAEAFAAEALRDLGDDLTGFRPGIYGALGDTYRRNGLWQEAQASYIKVLDFAHVPAFRIAAAHMFGAMADLELRQGHLREAGEYWRRAMASIEDEVTWGRLPFAVTGWVFVRMGEVLYEWNDLDAAWDHVERGLNRAEVGGDVPSRIAGCLIAARLKLTQGESEAAEAYLKRVRPLTSQAAFPEWSGRFDRLQVELWLAQNRLWAAVRWANNVLGDGNLVGAATTMAVARVLLFKGDAQSREQALPMLRREIEAAESEGRTGDVIEALALRALGCWSGGDRVAALTAMGQALQLAGPERYTRLFVDLGRPVAELLAEARARKVMPEYVERLLVAFDVPIPAAGGQRLPEPLSAREQEILTFLAAGLTNREIADQLVISPETVKKHTASIYAKLAVSNRTEAAARARDVGLLE